MARPRLLLVHSGGTIGMVQTHDGFAPEQGVVENFVRSTDFAADISIESLTPLIDSANAAPRDWDQISAIIAQNHAGFDGFVVSHGTDTLAYTAGALCYALAGLNKPVIVTGSMLPLSVKGNDGVQNLTDALRAAGTEPAGIRVQFAGRLLHGARVRKTHSRAFDAFNADPSDIPPLRPGSRFTRHQTGQARVVVLALAPGVPDDLFVHAAENYDGIVLRCYGSGTAPETEGLRRALQIAQARLVPVVAVSQCPEGGLALGTYAAAGILQENGVIDGRDMTVEAAYAKLHYVLSETPAHELRRDLLSRSLCGELTPDP